MSIFQPKWKSKDLRKRYKAIESGKLDDDTLLYMARHDVDQNVRYKATDAIRAQEKIAEALISIKSYSLGYVDTVYRATSHASFLSEIVKRVARPALLERIVLAKCDASGAALDQLDDLGSLKRILESSPAFKTLAERKIAEKTNDLELWLKIGKERGYDGEILERICKIKDKQERNRILKGIALTASSVHDRVDAIKKIHDKEILREIILSTSESYCQYSAIKNIHDEAILLEVLFSVPELYCQKAAIEGLRSEQALLAAFDSELADASRTEAIKRLIDTGVTPDSEMCDKMIPWLISRGEFVLAGAFPEDRIAIYGVTLRAYYHEETGDFGKIIPYEGYDVFYRGEQVGRIYSN